MSKATLDPAPRPPPRATQSDRAIGAKATRSLFDPAIMRTAVLDSLRKLHPRTMVHNPVMFVVWVGSIVTTVFFFRDIGDASGKENLFGGLVAAWLWFTVLFANFAEAVAEGRGKAHADTLRKARSKTGTITLCNRQAAELLALAGVSEDRLAAAAQLASLADETPEGRSIVVLAKQRYGIRERDLGNARLVPFTAQTRMSGLDVDGISVRKGAADSVRAWVLQQGGKAPDDLDPLVEGVATAGGKPLVVAEARLDGQRPEGEAAGTAADAAVVADVEVLGVVHLKDVVKQGMRQRFDQLRTMGIRTVIITGDNPLTARAIATEAGVDDFLAEATPEDEMALIRSEQGGGRLVAMTGDGTNDARHWRRPTWVWP